MKRLLLLLAIFAVTLWNVGCEDPSDVKNSPSASISPNDTTVGLNDPVHLIGYGEARNGNFGKIEQCAWKFGNLPWKVTGSMDTVIFAPSSPNPSYLCSLRVTDNDGNQGFAEARVIVKSDPPRAETGKDTIVGPNDPIFLHGVGIDSDSIITEYAWRIGNRPWVVTSTGDTTVLAPSYGVASYPCSLRVTDKDGEIGYDVMFVRVREYVPSAEATTTTPDVGINDDIILKGAGSDIDGSIVQYAWKFGDRPWIVTSTSDTIIKAPGRIPPENNYVCSLRVMDDDGFYGYARLSIKINEYKPYATADADKKEVGLCDTIKLIGQANDPFYRPRSVIEWAWKVGDKSPWRVTSTKDTTVLAPSYPGPFLCSLRVTDDDGLIDFSSVTIQVKSMPPIANAGKDTTVAVNGFISLSGKGSDEGGEIVQYEWKFGNLPWKLCATGDTVIRAPSVPQSYVCSLRVTDDDGESDVDDIIASITLDTTQYQFVFEQKVGSVTRLFKSDYTATKKMLLSDTADTNANLNYHTPRWSPDGQYIAYVKENTSGKSELWVMREDGTEKKHVSSAQEAGHPSWDANSTHLFYEANPKPDAASAIYKVDVSGGNAAPFIDFGNAKTLYPTIAPQFEKMMAYVYYKKKSDAATFEPAILRVRNLGSESDVDLATLTDSKDIIRNAEISPNGGFVLYEHVDMSDAGVVNGLTLYITSILGNQTPKEITRLNNIGTDWVLQGTFSPDGRKIYYVSGSDNTVYTCNLDGSNIVSLLQLTDGKIMFIDMK